MKKTSVVLFGITGSILIFIYAVNMVFFRQLIITMADDVPKFNPDSFILLISGILGLFGGLIGAAGSVLSFFSVSAHRRWTETNGLLWRDNRELSGIMLLGAAVSGAIMFAALTALFPLVHLTMFNIYATAATGIIVFIIFSVSGVVLLTDKRESKEE